MGRTARPAANFAGLLMAALLLLMASACDSSRPPAKKDAPTETEARPLLFQIRGNVRLQDGKDPIGIQVFCAGTSFSAFTDGDGNYVISATPPGAYVLVAQREGYESERIENLTLDAAQTAPEIQARTVELRPIPPPDRDLPPGLAQDAGMLTGWVALADRASPEGVRVELQGAPYSAIANSAGVFSLLNVAPGSYTALFSREGYDPLSLPVSILAGRVTRLSEPVQLMPSPALETENPGILGQVLFLAASGQPLETVSRAVVRLVENHRSAETNEDGAFEFLNLEPGRYTLVATAPGFTLNNPVEILLAEGIQTAVLMLRETRFEEELKGALTGVVRLGGRETENLAGTQVAIAGTSHSGLTDSAGRFTLSDIPEGSGVFIGSRPGYKTLEIPAVQILGDTVTDLGVLTLEPESDPPRVLSSVPANGARDVVIREIVPVRIVFSKRMDIGAVRAALSIQPACAWSLRRAGTSDNPQAPDVLEVLLSSEQPATALRFRTRYRLSIGEGARDIEGLALEEPFALTFTTAGLRVISSTPAQGATNAPVTSIAPLLIRFNGPVRRDSLNARNITFSPRPDAVGNIWNIGNDPRTGWTVLSLPLNLRHGTHYTVRFSNNIQAEDGTRLDSAGNSLSFRTIPAPTVTPLGR